MATAKAERLLNLVIALVNSPRYRSALWIRDKVAGYSDAPNDEAFFRTFERDKQELRELGIPVQTPSNGEDGYRIPPVDFALPAMTFTPAEAAALALAGRLWETTALATAGSGALRKIRDAAAGEVDAAAADVTDYGSHLPNGPAAAAVVSSVHGPEVPEIAAATLLQPRVRTGDPAFEPLYAAVRARRAVSFEYRRDPTGGAEARQLQPWGLVSFRGRWYVVGYDVKRGGRRTFRLSRISGPVKNVGRAGAVHPPDDIDLLAEVAASVQPPADRTATVRIRSGRAAGLRRTAMTEQDSDDAPGWDRLTLPLGSLWDTARRIAAHGPDVVVEEPADLVDATVHLLTATRRTITRRVKQPVAPAPDDVLRDLSG